MRFILDTNQIGGLIETDNYVLRTISKHCSLVLPPFIWAEALRGDPNAGRLGRLQSLNVRFGVDASEVCKNLETMTDGQIRHFEPLVRKGSLTHHNGRQWLRNPTPFHLKRAVELQSDRRAWARKMESGIRTARKQEQDARSRGESLDLIQKVEHLDDVLPRFSQSLRGDALWRTWLRGFDNGNAFVIRFVRCLIAENLTITQVWADDSLNFGNTKTGNDLSDMTLALYAGDGDIIVTADNRFRIIYEKANPYSRVKVLPWSRCLNAFQRL